LPLATNLVK